MNGNNLIHHDDAEKMLCPIARVSGRKTIVSYCVGKACILWRWEEIMAGHALWLKAMAKAKEETGEKTGPAPKAARLVADNPDHYGVTVERGWCGLGGKP